MLGSAHEYRLFDVQRGGVFQECLLEFGRIFLDADGVAGGVANDLVVNVSDVHRVPQVESALAEKAAKDIDRNEGAEIANVAVIVNGGTAGVHADLLCVESAEVFHFSGKRVVDAKRHEES